VRLAVEDEDLGGVIADRVVIAHERDDLAALVGPRPVYSEYSRTICLLIADASGRTACRPSVGIVRGSVCIARAPVIDLARVIARRRASGRRQAGGRGFRSIRDSSLQRTCREEGLVRTMNGSQSDEAGAGLFSCEVAPEREAVRVRPVGSLDMATAPVLRAQIDELRRAGFEHLIVDLSKLDFMDSVGLRLMLSLDAEARRDGFSIAIVPGPGAVQRVFEITGTTALLPFVATDGRAPEH
jgi:anti-anti-sigma factor